MEINVNMFYIKNIIATSSSYIEFYILYIYILYVRLVNKN